MTAKQSHRRKMVLCLIVLLLSASLLLTLGPTFARYLQQMAQVSYLFTPAVRETVTVFSEKITDANLENGKLPSTKPKWERIDGGMRLQCSVANGMPDRFARRDQLVSLQIAAGLPIADPQRLAVTLTYTDESGQQVALAGVPTPIADGSFRQGTYGDGWSYHFSSAQGEHFFKLDGGAFHYQNITVTVMGDVPATLLELQVTGSYGN